ncbi:hypothetical protein EVAR_89154_1 [Eumeta japonica]|uniref:Uncharacterized protein n=1 Tax=Eumeta variegata TaxID=151549 RepID=A0A4C1Z355_EUMVA|nr:hypothetical protein EVAR_89154_1 [Eumeta japonica]
MRRLKGGSRTRRTSVDRSSRSACDRPPRWWGISVVKIYDPSASSATAHTDARRSGGLRGPLAVPALRHRPRPPAPTAPALKKKSTLSRLLATAGLTRVGIFMENNMKTRRRTGLSFEGRCLVYVYWITVARTFVGARARVCALVGVCVCVHECACARCVSLRACVCACVCV